MKKLAIIQSSDIAAMAEELGKLTLLVQDEDKDQQSILRLKINYDTDSTVAKAGEWVIGQIKDKQGEIKDQGKKVVNFIPILVRNAYSYYNQKDTSLNCNSPLFKDYSEEVRGSRLKNVCGNDCPVRSRDSDKCKAQKVVFGVAITEDGEALDCVGYFAGVSYMPMSNYIDETKRLDIGGKKISVPICSQVASLSSEKQKNKSFKILKRSLVNEG